MVDSSFSRASHIAPGTAQAPPNEIRLPDIELFVAFHLATHPRSCRNTSCIEFCEDDAGYYRFNCAAMRCIDSREYYDKKIDVNQNHMNNSHLPSASDKAAVENPLPPAFPMKPKRGHYQVIDKLLILLILINVACLGYYLFVGYQFRFHSDSAAANLLAQEIYETGQYFPREWNYVFGDLWGVFMQTWIVMLLPFFPNGYAVHALGSIVGCIFTGLATWGVCTLMGASTRTRLLALALLSAGFTPNMSEHIYGQQAYGTIYYSACAVLVCGWKFLHAQGSARWRWGLASAVVVTLLVWPNPQRAMVYYLMPLFAGLGAAYGTMRRSKLPGAPPVSRFAVLSGIVVLGILAGIICNRLTFAGRELVGSSFAVLWTDFPNMTNNVMRAIQGLAAVLGGLPTPQTPIASGAGIVSALQFVAGLTLLVLLPFAMNQLLRSRHPGRAFLAAAGTTSFAASFFIFATSTLALNGPAEESARYMVPGLVMAVMALVTYMVDQCETGSVRRFAGLVAMVVLMLSAPITFGVVDIRTHLGTGGIAQANPKVRLARFLEAQGLRYGYATFWHAGQTTVLSNSVVKVRQIEFASGLPRPRRHLSSNRWYESDAWRGPSFILLAKDEVAVLDLLQLATITGQPTRRVEFEDYVVLIFDHNIAADFADWQIRIVKPVRFQASPGRLHAIGKYVPEAQALTADKGEAGALHFGPYRYLPAGRYVVTFDVRVEADGVRDFGMVDVAGDGGKQILARQTIERIGLQRITLPVRVDKAADGFEFRVFSTGAGKISLLNIELANDNHR